jgi:hypothetical protein
MNDRLRVGELAYDIRAGALGVVMEVYGGLYWLRPPAGGVEWDAKQANVRRATTADRLRPAVAAANALSRRAVGAPEWAGAENDGPASVRGAPGEAGA